LPSPPRARAGPCPGRGRGPGGRGRGQTPASGQAPDLHQAAIRKTARAPEGEPLPIPGRTAAKPEPGREAAAEDAKKKKKKKKKGKTAEEAAPVEVFEEAPPKKKLRRKIAFKVQRGMEGMEIADIEQMYVPSRKKITTKKKAAKKTLITTPKAAKRIIRMGNGISVSDLARQLGVKSHEIIKA